MNTIPRATNHSGNCKCNPVAKRNRPLMSKEVGLTDPDHQLDEWVATGLLRAFADAAERHGQPLYRTAERQGQGFDFRISDCDARQFKLLCTRVAALVNRMAADRVRG